MSRAVLNSGDSQVKQKAADLVCSLGFVLCGTPFMTCDSDVSVGVRLSVRGTVRKLKALGAPIYKDTKSKLYGGVWIIPTPYGRVEVIDCLGGALISFINGPRSY